MKSRLRPLSLAGMQVSSLLRAAAAKSTPATPAAPHPTGEDHLSSPPLALALALALPPASRPTQRFP